MANVCLDRMFDLGTRQKLSLLVVDCQWLQVQFNQSFDTVW